MKVALIFEPGHRIGPILQQWFVSDGHTVSMISDNFTDKNRAGHYDLIIPYVMPRDFLDRPNPRFTAASYLEKRGFKMLNSILSIGHASSRTSDGQRTTFLRQSPRCLEILLYGHTLPNLSL